MEHWQIEVLAERDALEVKLQKINRFINNLGFNAIDETQKDLLLSQREAMESYYFVLGKRITAFVVPQITSSTI